MPVKITHPPDPVIIMYLSVAPDEELQHQLHIMRIFMVSSSLLLLLVLLLLLLLSFIVRCRSYRIIVSTLILQKGMEKREREKKRVMTATSTEVRTLRSLALFHTPPATFSASQTRCCSDY